MKGILGRKVGMTQIYSETGQRVPVTVIEVQPNVVSKVLTDDKNGYVATQLAVFDKKASRSNKPETGHFAKANTTPKRYVKEVRGMSGYELGQEIKADIFVAGELVDVTGTSKGKGFAGTIKRHNQHIGPKSHGGGGGSQPVRQTGSLGDISGNKVVKGMTMPGQLGNVKTTVQNLEIIKVDLQNNLLLIKGSIPGPKKGFVMVKEAVKGLPSHDAVVLVDVQEVMLMNELVEKAKKYNVEVTVGMHSDELKKLIEEAEAKEGDK
ncbi:50S ribosomal protein L3 [Mycoplasmopsis gallopavonis]|uniref:Large ribosomal subunit protein uL3 n=1 Tax=Mycoplasmopsis gallopavonis TaxID=76629 RepID=A0A449AYX4_9BACT|nr:50S ribosomal protein L3 [Mycoplasmopsis gallopavonis]RIV16580.1 50S ribosomal protein L3 [Mycoplasmopsis gallopavonis]VEU72710.1 50S ribosomal protein L3 [Mycoplasmopsis gallopavonis]